MKDQRINILGFVAIQWSLAITQLFHCNIKTETIHIQMTGCVPIKLFTKIGSGPDLARKRFQTACLVRTVLIKLECACDLPGILLKA